MIMRDRRELRTDCFYAHNISINANAWIQIYEKKDF